MQAPTNVVIGNAIRRFIDWGYTPFSRYFPKQFFRYGVCGASNLVFGWFLYGLFYNFVFKKQIFDMGFMAFTPHIAALFLQLPITFFSGFWLNKYVSFSESKLKGKIQITRYLLVVTSCVVINYLGLKFMVEICHIYPTPSQMIATTAITVYSYFAQKNYSFKS